MLIKLKAAYNNMLNKFSKLETKVKQFDKHQLLPVIFLSIIIVLILEMLSRRSIISGLGFIINNPLMFLVNVTIVLITLSITLMVPRKKFFIALFTMIWLLLGVGNFILMSYRPTPLTAMDLYILSSVSDIIGVYLNVFQIVLIIIGLAFFLFCLIFLWKKFKKSKAQYKRPIIMVCVSYFLMFISTSVAIKANVLSNNFGNLPDAYSNYGFAYCFSNSIFDRGISKPQEYSEEEVDRVVEKIEKEATNHSDDNSQTPTNSNEVNNDGVTNDDKNINDPDTLDDTKTDNLENKTTILPNVIIVQLESFFDVNHLYNYTFSENPVPNFTRLKENYSYGYLTVPSIGAGTVNTEFEVLTGMNRNYFGAGEYPYKTILQTTTCESIGYNLGELGYYSHAIHNNTGTFYDRYEVYKRLGFDSFSSIEYMNNVEFNPLGWAKDKILTTEIFKALDAGHTHDFIYTVSVQPHGKYPDIVIDENQTIKVIADPNKKLALQNENILKEFDTVDGEVWKAVTNINNTDQELNTNNVNEESGNKDTEDEELDKKEPDNYDTDSKDNQNQDTDIIENAVEDNSNKDKESVEDRVVDNYTDDANTGGNISTEKENKEVQDSNEKDEIDLYESYKNQFEYYVNQLHETDAFIGELTSTLANYEQPTIVVFYGDHLPSLSLQNEDLENNNIYQTEYVMWSNYPMEQVKQDLYAYQLSSYIMERIKLDNGVLTKFHQNCKEDLDYEEELRLLQYDMLYGNRNVYKGQNPYEVKDLQMGISEISISDVEEKGEAVIVHGLNFTPYSTVYMNEKAKETIYIDENTLIVPYEKISDKGIYVAQVTEGKVVLSKSKEWKLQN